MAKEILNNDERLLLIEKYEADKLNKPPKNIKDATLITNYGTDEQKARLQAAQTAAAQQATENKAATPTTGANAAGTENGATGTAPAEPAANATPVIPKAEDTVQSTGTQGGFIDGTAQSTAEQPKPVQDQAPAVTTETPAPAAAPTDNEKHIQAFNEYVDLFLKMPADTLTTDELVRLNAGKREEAAKKAQEAEELKQAAALHQVKQAAEMVTIINNDTKESTVVSRFTWDRFISKDGTHSIKPETPAELQ